MSSVRPPKNSGNFPVKILSDAQLKQEKVMMQTKLLSIFKKEILTLNRGGKKKGQNKYRIIRDFKFANSCGIGPETPLLSMYLKENK